MNSSFPGGPHQAKQSTWDAMSRRLTGPVSGSVFLICTKTSGWFWLNVRAIWRSWPEPKPNVPNVTMVAPSGTTSGTGVATTIGPPAGTGPGVLWAWAICCSSTACASVSACSADCSPRTTAASAVLSG